jgi:hypothetical protein
VYWFVRPPYLRYVGAVLLVVAAAWIDLRPVDTIPYPFAAKDLASGTVIDQHSIEWREVPRGLLPPAPPIDGTVRSSITRGEPVIPSVISEEAPQIPDGWWALSVTLPHDVVVGQTVQLVIAGAAPRAFPGIVIESPPPADPLSYTEPIGLVAVSGDSAVPVATGVAEGTITVLVGPAP